MNKKGIVLSPEFEKAIFELGFSEFTEIQEKCIPLIQQGRDVIGSSYTGSGKTAAFGFPSLEKVVPGKGIQLLVLVPTRELCTQVAHEFRRFTKYRKTSIIEIYGGVSLQPQFSSLRHADVVIGTPGRILDHLSRNTLNLSLVKILVLDEADKMFEMGFVEDITRIISHVPKHSQKLLFSATIYPEILNIAKNYLNNPEKVKMQSYVDKSKLVQHYYEVDKNNKFSLLVHLLNTEVKGLVVVFCGTRIMCDIVNKNLNKQNIRSEAIHGGLTQSRRNSIMVDFRDGRLDVLIASDVIARGLDIKKLNLVINYNLPKSSREYVHRIGRTARAGEEGKVVSLLSHEDHDNFRNVLEDRSLLIHRMELPSFKRLEFIRPMQNRQSFSRGFSRGNNFNRGGGNRSRYRN